MLVLHTVLHGGENCIVKAMHASRKIAAEMKYTRKMAGNAWADYKTNTVVKWIQERNWLQHINIMPHNS